MGTTRVLVGAAALLLGGHALAANYPTKLVRLVVPFTPGGTTDIVARIVAQKLSEVWDKQVVIDNRGGAGGSIAAEKTLWGEAVREIMSKMPQASSR